MPCQQAVNGKQSVSFKCLVQGGLAGFLSLIMQRHLLQQHYLLWTASRQTMHGRLCFDVYFPQPQSPFLHCLAI